MRGILGWTRRIAMRWGWSGKKDRIVLFGEVPWGYRLSQDRTALVADEDEQRITAIVRHMSATGLSIREIVEKLDQMGVVGRRGKPIVQTRVFEMLHGGRKAAARAGSRRGKTRRASAGPPGPGRGLG